MHTPRIFNNQKYLLFFINFIRSYINTATLNLLTSSILVSISGAFRVYIASLLLGTRVTPLVCLAGGLVIYSVYTLDRALDSKEDLINHPELDDSCRELGIVLSILSLICGGWVFLLNGLLIFTFVPFVIGFLYSKGLKIGSSVLKLKGSLGGKNLVVGCIWGVSVVGVAGATCQNIPLLILVFTYFVIKLFVNSTIYDFRDIPGDFKAGIKTLPVYLGEQKTRNFLLGLHLVSHLLLSIGMINGVVAFEPVIVVYSFVCGLGCIRRYTKIGAETESMKLQRTAFIDGESVFITLIRASLSIV